MTCDAVVFMAAPGERVQSVECELPVTHTVGDDATPHLARASATDRAGELIGVMVRW